MTQAIVRPIGEIERQFAYDWAYWAIAANCEFRLDEGGTAWSAKAKFESCRIMQSVGEAVLYLRATDHLVYLKDQPDWFRILPFGGAA